MIKPERIWKKTWKHIAKWNEYVNYDTLTRNEFGTLGPQQFWMLQKSWNWSKYCGLRWSWTSFHSQGFKGALAIRQATVDVYLLMNATIIQSKMIYLNDLVTQKIPFQTFKSGSRRVKLWPEPCPSQSSAKWPEWFVAASERAASEMSGAPLTTDRILRSRGPCDLPCAAQRPAVLKNLSWRTRPNPQSLSMFLLDSCM